MVMKLHDNHVLLQQILLVCMWHRMDKAPRDVVMRICKVFKLICNPALHEVLKIGAMITLCLLEKVFPLRFSHLMMHPVVHLVDELDLCSP
jgi:hypothetical protein